jgi:hypothetical protein
MNSPYVKRLREAGISYLENVKSGYFMLHYLGYLQSFKNRDSSVGIATRLWTGQSRVRFPTGTQGIFLFTTVSSTAL